MKLENIKIDADAKIALGLIRDLEKLPDETVVGISEYGSFTVRRKDDGGVRMYQADSVCRNAIVVRVPKGSENVVAGSGSVAFRYKEIDYEIRF